MQPSGYCFPDISRSADEGPPAKPGTSSPLFQRQPPGTRGTSCPTSKTKPGKYSEQARADLEQEAYCRGFSDGEKSGFEQGIHAEREGVSGRLEKVLKSVEAMFSELQHLHSQIGRVLEKETVQLAMEVARKVVSREVQTDVKVVTQMVGTAMSRLENADNIRVRLNPEEFEHLGEFAPGMLARMADAHRVNFEADAAISRGGCLIESDSGDIDARLEQLFKAVEEAFQTEWRKQSFDPG